MKHRYKDGFNPKITVSKEFGPRVRKILELDMELDRYILSATDHLDLLTEVYASNIYWSTSLEGNPLSEDEVRIVTRDTLSGNMKESRNGPVQEVIITSSVCTLLMRSVCRGAIPRSVRLTISC
ncbi:MAG TPA: hypothetical protein PK446_05535 [Methanomassiliicoccaceae archaeon]|nr:hypothetical protein [Methanomassiliicoccaceae archaeon]